MKRTVADLRKLIGTRNCTIIGDLDRSFSSIAPIGSASSGTLTFCAKKGEEAITLLQETRASVIICDIEMLSHVPKFREKTLVGVGNPRLWFIRSVRTFFSPKLRTGIHQTAIIGKKCQISENCYIGPFVTIGDEVIIGNGTRIYDGVHIHDRVRIGKNVVLKSGCIIGGDGFGFERNEEGTLEKFPHIGGVIIEDDVEIGSSTCVDRGTLANTVIGKGTKIDNLVHIAHNVVIGEHCVIVALAMIGGGTKICDGAWVAPTACVRDGIVIGKQSLVGMGAVVTKSVDDKDVVVGVPAKSIKKTKM
jgi:UDP-3-O-[3-hydroxymyristoyl] glucosamine N-acyltransferase